MVSGCILQYNNSSQLVEISIYIMINTGHLKIDIII